MSSAILCHSPLVSEVSGKKCCPVVFVDTTQQRKKPLTPGALNPVERKPNTVKPHYYLDL